MELKESYKKWVSILLVYAIVNLSGGCYNFFKVTSTSSPSSEAIAKQKNDRKTIIVHYNDEKWTMTGIDIANNTVKGKLEKYDKPLRLKPVDPNKPNRYYHRQTNDERYLLNEVHLYLNEFAKDENNLVSIPVNSINKIEIYDKDTGATVGSYFLGFLGVTVVAFAITAIFVAIFKESCPFIYSWNGNSYQFEGEIYSGSIYKPLERNDYLKLSTYQNQSVYQLKITNEVREIQHTNQLELIVIDHPKNSFVLVDKNGKIHSPESLMSPVSALAGNGQNVTAMVNSKDDIYYQSNYSGNNIPIKDYLVLEFPDQGIAKTAQLAIHGKNSIMLDYMVGEFNDLFGSAFNRYNKSQSRASGDGMRQWSLDQGIPLSLYVERAGNWEFVDYYNIAGPMKFKDDILQIPLKGNETKPLKVKLEFGTFLWEINYAAIDYSADTEFTSWSISPKLAINENRTDITSLIAKDDQQYYTQPETTNYAEVTFNLPQPTDQGRTVVLHSKGWYSIIQDPQGKPDIVYLKSFKNPGQFNQFVISKLKEMEERISQ